MHQIRVLPPKRAVSATVVQSSKRTVADRHRLAAHHNKHCWRGFWRSQHRWPWRTLFQTAAYISRVNCVEIWLEIDQITCECDFQQ